MPRSVHILAFDEMEVLDYAGPYEVFNVAGDLTDPRAFNVAAVGVTPMPTGRGGFKVVAPYALDSAPKADIIVVPGGRGTRRLMHDERVLGWLRERSTDVELLLTVCTGSLVTGAAGLLDGLDATTHHTVFEQLSATVPSATVIKNKRFVRSSDKVRTSAGVSAGVDLALAVVEELEGIDLRQAVEDEMEWMWTDGE